MTDAARVIVLRGDAARLPLPDESVDLIVTSPPYWGLRSYSDGGKAYPGQVGSEATPREYVAALLDCTREWTRVLKPGGSLFVNLGDKYAQDSDKTVELGKRDNSGVPRKSLLGLPWRYAIGCVDDLGLILRAEIVWSKVNGLPESVTDRVRRAHEQVFHFTRQPRYFAAVDEVREPRASTSPARSGRAYSAGDQFSVGTPNTLDPTQFCNPLGKLPGSVWPIPSAPLKVPAELGVDHFAAYPPELVRRIVLGWSPSGICPECGEGRRPVVERTAGAVRHEHGTSWNGGSIGLKGRVAAPRPRGVDVTAAITGYACACPEPDAPTRPAVVLDPFGGTGTTALVASVHGRTGITIDKSADYCRIARWRTSDPGQRARAIGKPKPKPVQQAGDSLFDGDAAS